VTDLKKKLGQSDKEKKQLGSNLKLSTLSEQTLREQIDSSKAIKTGSNASIDALVELLICGEETIRESKKGTKDKKRGEKPARKKFKFTIEVEVDGEKLERSSVSADERRDGERLMSGRGRKRRNCKACEGLVVEIWLKSILPRNTHHSTSGATWLFPNGTYSLYEAISIENWEQKLRAPCEVFGLFIRNRPSASPSRLPLNRQQSKYTRSLTTTSASPQNGQRRRERIKIDERLYIN